MWGAIAAAALGIGSSIYGGIQSSRAARKAKDYIEDEKKENENWYNRRYNEDVTQRADAQRALTQAEEAVRRRNRAAAGQQAVMGGTEESTAATKAANAQALSDATSQIAAQGAAEKDKVEEQYRQTKSNLDNQLVGVENTRAQNVANATQGALNAAANIGAADMAFGGKNGTGAATGATAATSPLPDNANLKMAARKSIFDVANSASSMDNYLDDYVTDPNKKYLNDVTGNSMA